MLFLFFIHRNPITLTDKNVPMSSVNLTGIREKLQFPLLKIFLRAFLKSTVFSCSEQRKKTLT